MTATGVSDSTAQRALRPLKTQPVPQRVNAEPARVQPPTRDADLAATAAAATQADATAPPEVSPSLTLRRQTRDNRTGSDATADQTRSGSRGERTVLDEPPRGDRRSETAGRVRGGDVVIEQARTAVAVLAAHGQLREQHRREHEQARVEQLNRWHDDDAQQVAARAREGWGLAR